MRMLKEIQLYLRVQEKEGSISLSDKRQLTDSWKIKTIYQQ